MTYWEQVKEYHDSHKSSYVFFGDNADNFKGLGIELEFDRLLSNNSDYFREQVAKILLTHQQSDHYFVERDASLRNGMELITQPHTIEEMRTFLSTAMPDILLQVREAGAENFSRHARLHIHISKTVFGATVEEQSDNLAKLLYCYAKHSRQLFKLSNLKNDRKCNFPTPGLTIEDAKTRTERELNPETESRTIERYHSINLKQPNTVEFRAWAGTTDINVLTACVELVWHLANKTTTITWEDTNDWDKWIEGAPQIVLDYIKWR